MRWRIPDDLPSGVYAVKLGLGTAKITRRSSFAPAPHHRRAPVAYLAATATYIAYANQRLGFSGAIFPPRKPQFANDVYLLEHPEVGIRCTNITATAAACTIRRACAPFST